MLALLTRQLAVFAALCIVWTSGVAAQDDIATRNVHILKVVQHDVDAPPGDLDRTIFLAVEENESRPFVYVSPSVKGQGFDVFQQGPGSDVKIRTSVSLAEQDAGGVARDIKFFKSGGMQYVVLAVQQPSPTPNALAAIVYDVNEAVPVEVARIITAEGKGFRHLFVYKHSSGATNILGAGDGAVHVYDAGKLVSGQDVAFITAIESPEQPVESLKGFRDVFAGYHPASGQDRLYASGAGGYYVYDFTSYEADSVIASVNPAGILYGHKVAPVPSGSGILTAADYRTAPLRYYNLQPVFDGEVPRIRTAVGAWTANWCNYAQQFEVRWPYAFVAAMEDGFQMINLRDHENPYTTAYARTSSVTTDCDPNAGHRGAYDVEVRNRDGLIVVGDLGTGLWFLNVEGFDGWHGHGWGVPNVSTVQDWENGPDIIGG